MIVRRKCSDCGQEFGREYLHQKPNSKPVKCDDCKAKHRKKMEAEYYRRARERINERKVKAI